MAFAFGPLAFAAAGPVAAVVGARTVLGFGATWSTVSCAAVLVLPAVRPSRDQPTAVCRARKAAALTRFWQVVEQNRRVPLREVST